MSKNDKEKKAYDEGPELLFDVADKQRKAKQAAEAKSEETKAQEAAETKQPEPPQPEEAPQQAAEADPKQIEEAVNAAVKDQEDKYMRLLAEYDNYRKRTAKEKDNLYQDAKADTIKEFLAVYDNLERAVATEGDEDSPHKKGLEMIFHQYQEILKKLGVTEIEAQGQPFDPEKHNAVMHIDDENLGENVVSQVFQAGFLLGDKVIRHAIVQVAN